MIDSLGASELFARFDDEHLARHGHRLASDPYWIAPPQGSIVPLWHRGGSPNYQPKPMICHHRQDPVKAWRREHTSQACREIDQTSRLSIKLTLGLNPSDNHGRIFIGYCSSGTVALKLCQKLEGRLADAAKANTSFGKVMPIRALNALKNTSFAGGDVLVIIASNTRKGEMPINGVEFLQALQTDDRVIPGRYAIFGNGSMDYVDTYCQTAKLLENLLLKRRLSPVIETIYADTAIENPPWTAFSQFSMQLVQSLHGLPPTPESEREAQALETVMPAPTRTHFEVAEWSPANIVEVVRGPVDRSTKTVTIDVGDRKYAPMSYVSILPPNQATEVGDILSGLNARGDESLACANGMPIRAFLHYYADLQGPFRDVDWAYDMMSLGTVKPDDLRSLPVIRAVSRLPTNWRHWTTMEQLCSAIPRIQPRKYSIASDYDFNKTKGAQPSQLELFVQHHDGGRFSDCCLGDIQTFPSAVCRIEKNSNLTRLAGATDTPLVLFSTGSGIAPIRALLQHRMNLLESKSASSPHHAPITLISGHKASDHDLVKSIVAEARPLGLFDAVSLTPSNPEGRRAQDAVFAADMRDKVLSKIKAGGTVFVCARPEAEEDFVVNLRAILGVVDARRILGDRYVSEIYQHAV